MSKENTGYLIYTHFYSELSITYKSHKSCQVTLISDAKSFEVGGIGFSRKMREKGYSVTGMVIVG